MNLRSDIKVGIGLLLAIQVATTLSAIALLGRMRPAIRHVISENVESLTAVERMLDALVRLQSTGTAAAAREQLEAAFAKAERNVTVKGEREIILRIGVLKDRLLGGQADARELLLGELARLAAVNQKAMHEASARASSLGLAGAWAAFLLGVLSILASVVVVRRLYRHLLSPLREILDTLEAARLGDPHRRCRTGEVPGELDRAAQEVNLLLDRHVLAPAETLTPQSATDRALLLTLLDARPEPVAVVSRSGSLLVANVAAEALLAAPEADALRAALADVPAGTRSPLVPEALEVRGGAGWICVLRPAGSDPTDPG
jgi:PAS domain-containing protein